MTTRVTNRTKIYALANEMRGIITADMAREAGVPLVEMRKLVQRGALERVARNLYRVPFAPLDDATLALEAIHTVGPSAYISGQSVLALLDLGVFNPRQIEVSTTINPRRQIPRHINVKVLSPSQAGHLVTYMASPANARSRPSTR